MIPSPSAYVSFWFSSPPLPYSLFRERESDRARNIQEIKFGDNDTLSAITSSMVHADYLFLLTDVDGLYSANPRKDPNAKFLEVVSSVAEARLEGREPSRPSLHYILRPDLIFPSMLHAAHNSLFHLLFLFIFPQTEKKKHQLS